MPTSTLPFTLVITGHTTPRRYTAFVEDEDGGRTAEQAFEWRFDSTALNLDLARQLVEGAQPDRLTPQIMKEFEQAWQSILEGIENKERMG